MKYKVGDKVKIKSIDWYNKNKDNFGRIDCGEWIFTESYTQYCGKVMTIRFMCEDGEYYKMVESELNWSDEMIEGLMEEKTPKFKVKNIVFVKDIGWVIITNSYWDSLANEYIYEGIGFNEEGQYYDSIYQSDIECQMPPESENPGTRGNKITLDEYKNNDKEWLFNKLASLDNITALESIQDIFNHLQNPKYPITYVECCKIMQVARPTIWFDYDDVSSISKEGDEYESHIENILCIFRKLLICRGAYWKIYGDQMGLGKPWEPDFTNDDEERYGIYTAANKVVKDFCGVGDVNTILTFPTVEMRDAFYENFKDLIEECKELL
jgi:hypothetical protein